MGKWLTKLTSKIAIFAVVFASFAPTVSHALAAHQGKNTLTQEICTSTGTKKIVVQTITTKGQQVTAALSGKTSEPSSSAAHLDHCPFCGASAHHISVEPPVAAWVAIVEAQAKAANQDFVGPSHADPLLNAHPSRAPPQL